MAEIETPLPWTADELASLERVPVRDPALSLSDDWSTPQALFDQLDAEFAFTLDVAASDKNAKCGRYLTLREDGLRQRWAPERCFLNPPYGRGQIPRWMAKTIEEVSRGALVVALLPSYTETAWFHDLVHPHAEVRFVRGRLRFEPGSTSARFPNLVAVFRPMWGPYRWICAS